MTKTEHLLVCLMEECAELQKEASKAIRFGILSSDIYKDDTKSHAENILREFCDVVAIMELLNENNDVDLGKNMLKHINHKKEKTIRYMNNSRKKQGL